MSVTPYLKSQFPCSIVHIKPQTSEGNTIEVTPTTPLFIFVPGNPGLIEYYQEFLQEIHQKHKNWEILGISHVGMSERANSQTQIFTLQEQVNHQIHLINNFSKFKGRKLIINAHSIGAYIIQRAIISKRLVGSIIKINMITPVIMNIHTSEKGVSLNRSFYWIPQLITYLSYISYFLFFWILSEGMSRWLINRNMKCNTLTANAVSSSRLFLSRRELVRQSMGLAKEELQVVKTNWEFQEKFVKYCNSENVSVWLLFCASDHWITTETRDDLKEYYIGGLRKNNLKIETTDTVRHAFVIRQSKYVVDKYF